LNIKLTQEYIDKNMVGDDEWIDLWGNEKNGKVFRYKGNTYLIRGFVAFTSSIYLYEISKQLIHYEIIVPCDEFYSWMCERMKPRLDRERKEYDLNQVQI
jgi:hypothetical protein